MLPLAIILLGVGCYFLRDPSNRKKTRSFLESFLNSLAQNFSVLMSDERKAAFKNILGMYVKKFTDRFGIKYGKIVSIAFASIMLVLIVAFCSNQAKDVVMAKEVNDFANATCVLKEQMGNPPAEQAATMMIAGVGQASPEILNAWTAHTGGDTYWGNIQAGKNAIAFIDWIAEQPSTEKATEILLSAVKRKCG